MQRRILVSFLVALVLTIGVFVTLDAIGPAPTLARQTGTATTAETVTVTVRDFEFDPETITITVGTTVRWENVQGVHNVDADDSSFDSGALAPAPWTYTHTFTVPGTYLYHCDAHGAPNGIGMSGKVVVQELPPAAYLPIILKEE